MADYNTTVGVQIEAISDNEIASLKRLESALNSVILKLKLFGSISGSVNKKNNGLNALIASLKSSSGSTSKLNSVLAVLQSALSGVKRALSGVANVAKKMHSAFKLNIVSIGKMLFLFNIFKYLSSSITSAIKKSTDFGETINLWSVAMKDAENEALKFQNTLNNTVGLSINTMMNAQAKFKNMIGSLSSEITNAQQEAISETISLMALDYASLYNVDFDESVTKFMAALAGQVRPIRNTSGYDITQNTLQEELSNLNIDRTVSSLTQVEKRLLIISALMRQMSASGAMNDLAKTLERPANQLRILQELWSDLVMYIGGVFYPMLSKTLPYLNGLVWALRDIFKTISSIVGYDPFENMVSDPLGSLIDDEESASEEADKLKNKLAGFDELNIITQSDDEDTNLGGISSELLSAISDYDRKLLSVEQKATKIRDALMEWLGFSKEINEETSDISWTFEKMPVADYASLLANKLNDILEGQNVNDLGSKIGNFLNEAFVFAVNFVTNLNFQMLGSKIVDFFNGIFEAIDPINAGSLVSLKLKSIIDLAFGALTNMDVNEISNYFINFLSGILSNIDMERIKEALMMLVDKAVNLINNILNSEEFDIIIDNLVLFINYLGDELVVIIENADWIDIFTALFRVLNAIVGALIENLPEIIPLLLNGVTAALKAVFTDSNFIWIGLAIIAGIASAFMGAPALLAAAISVFVAGLIKQFCNLLGINSPSKVFKEQIGANIVAGIKEGILGGLTSLKKAAKEVYDAIINVFGNIGSAIKEKVNSGLNNVKSFVSSIPLIGNVAKYIPTLASGGIISSGQMFIARESGPELVGTINGNSAVMNNSDIVSAVSNGVANALMNVLGNSSSNLVINLDGKILAKSAINNINKMTRQSGISPLII